MRFDGYRGTSAVRNLRFLLVNPTDSRVKFGYIPLGMAYIAGILEANGVFVRCINYTVEDYDPAEFSRFIRENAINVIGISGFTPHIYATYRIAKLAKMVNPDIKVIIGGPHPTVLPEEALDNGADIVIKGEAEGIIYELLPLLEEFDREQIAKVRGISLKIDGKMVSTARPSRIMNLDALPFPARHLFKYFPDPEYYRTMLPLNLRKGWRSTTIITSRGCTAHCVFCNKQVFGSTITYRSPENIMAEIRELVEKYKIDEISMADDYFTASPDRVKELCRLIIDSKIGIRWICSNTRVDVLDDEMYRIMKESGCYRVNYGIESGVQRVIDGIRKGITLEQAKEAISLANKYNFQIFVNFMVGHHCETEEDIKETIKFARTLNVDFIQFGISTPFPGTPIYRKYKAEGRLLANKWTDYDYSSRVIFYTDALDPSTILKWYRRSWKLVSILNPRFIFRHVRRFLFDRDTSRSQYMIALSEFLKRIFMSRWL